MVTFICEYCGRAFKRKYNLQIHKKQTRYCLEKQHGLKEETISHGIKDDTQVLLIDLISQLQQTITTMATTQSSVNNNRQVVLNNLQPLTDEDLREHLEQLTLDFIQEGAKGYADFAGSYPFKDRLVCTDKSRKKLRYKDVDGEVVNDNSGTKLTQRFFQAISTRNEEIINAEYRSLHKEVQKIAQDGTAHRTDLTGLLNKASKLQELLISCQQAARGEENELTKEFVSHLTKKF